MSRALIAGMAALIVAIVLGFATLFTVGQTEQSLVTEFGKPIRVVSVPGLHARIPFVQSVIDYDRRLLWLHTPGEEVILGDQRRLIVDSFTMYRISDPLRFYQAAGVLEDAITGRLNAIVSSAIRRVLGNRTLPDVLSADRDRIMASIRQQVDTEMRGFGVTVEDVRIRRADLPRENTEAVLTRMQSERSASPRRPAPRGRRPARASAPTPSATAPCCSPTPTPRPTSCAAKARRRRPSSTPTPTTAIPASTPRGGPWRPIARRSTPARRASCFHRTATSCGFSPRRHRLLHDASPAPSRPRGGDLLRRGVRTIGRRGRAADVAAARTRAAPTRCSPGSTPAPPSSA